MVWVNFFHVILVA